MDVDLRVAVPNNSKFGNHEKLTLPLAHIHSSATSLWFVWKVRDCVGGKFMHADCRFLILHLHARNE